MLIVYRLLINIIFFLSPLIISFRLIKGKENIYRFKEKIGFFSKKKFNEKLYWFHGASVGELKSIIPIIDKLEKKNKVKKILITSNTLSSSKIFENLKYKKIIHQFFPIDVNFITKKFLDYWKPSKVFFIDSEIWPNMILNIKKRNIPLILINGRISNKSLKRWMFLKSFSKKIFSKFDLCLSSSEESKKNLIKLNAKNVKYIGNLKFAVIDYENKRLPKKIKKIFITKNIWCASSTHKKEEILCGKIHLNLKSKIKNLLTIIIPRHVERSLEIKNDLEKLNLKVHLHMSNKKIKRDTDIYLVNTYGATKLFFSNCKIVFLGGSLVNHGGQNPLEAARLQCNILHGKYIYNFNEIYKFLSKNKISFEIKNQKEFLKYLIKLFNFGAKKVEIKKKIDLIGNKILRNSLKEIDMI